MSTDEPKAIDVVEYDSSWPVLFEEIRAGLEQLLEGLVLEIHHIGSTAVPGLWAKPKIESTSCCGRPRRSPRQSSG